ncbi:MAG: hypothetical protein AB7V16_10250 [Vulcanibacillus sp.]
MIPERKLQEYQNELNENEKQIRKLVLESYNDIVQGKGREYKTCSIFRWGFNNYSLSKNALFLEINL